MSPPGSRTLLRAKSLFLVGPNMDSEPACVSLWRWLQSLGGPWGAWWLLVTRNIHFSYTTSSKMPPHLSLIYKPADSSRTSLRGVVRGLLRPKRPLGADGRHVALWASRPHGPVSTLALTQRGLADLGRALSPWHISVLSVKVRKPCPLSDGGCEEPSKAGSD